MDYMDGLEVSHCSGVVYQRKGCTSVPFYIVMPVFEASFMYKTSKLRDK